LDQASATLLQDEAVARKKQEDVLTAIQLARKINQQLAVQ